jgi:hypothetical protein
MKILQPEDVHLFYEAVIKTGGRCGNAVDKLKATYLCSICPIGKILENGCACDKVVTQAKKLLMLHNLKDL